MENEYDDFNSIPAEYRHFYREVEGKWVLLKASEIKTTGDVETLQTALSKERTDHKATKSKLREFDGLDATEVRSNLDRIAELEAGQGQVDDAKLNELVEARITTRLNPVQRELDKAREDLEAANTSVAEYKERETKSTISDALRKACTSAKVRDSAVEDAIMIGSADFVIDEHTGKVVTKDGLAPDVWLTECKENRPHWWPESAGAGGGGGGGAGGGANPFTAENWNVTEQGNIFRQSPEKANQLAKAAGTTVGGRKPAPK